MENKTSFWNNTLFGFAIKNFFIAGIIVLVLTLFVLIFLKFYTHHGQSETVPDIKNSTIEEASLMLERHNLTYEIIDSVFVRDKKLGTVIEQNPAPNTIVKPKRTVYLIINSKAVRQLALPNLRDISLRQAEAMAKSLGITVSNIHYAPSEYKDLVLDVKYKGQSLLPGSKIPEGSSIVLVAGNGVGQLVDGLTPGLVGLDLTAATNLLASTDYLLGGVIYDEVPDNNEAEYQIFRQMPAAGEPIAPGTIIDVWLSKDPVQANNDFVQPRQPAQKGGKKEKTKDIEEFF
ncbi:MAG: PASTA domain-containing protein [Paludibacteraceae bacterium]